MNEVEERAGAGKKREDSGLQGGIALALMALVMLICFFLLSGILAGNEAVHRLIPPDIEKEKENWKESNENKK